MRLVTKGLRGETHPICGLQICRSREIQRRKDYSSTTTMHQFNSSSEVGETQIVRREQVEWGIHQPCDESDLLYGSHHANDDRPVGFAQDVVTEDRRMPVNLAQWTFRQRENAAASAAVLHIQQTHCTTMVECISLLLTKTIDTNLFNVSFIHIAVARKSTLTDGAALPVGGSLGTDIVCCRKSESVVGTWMQILYAWIEVAHATLIEAWLKKAVLGGGRSRTRCRMSVRAGKEADSKAFRAPVHKGLSKNAYASGRSKISVLETRNGNLDASSTT